MKTSRACSFDGCVRDIAYTGLCGAHNAQRRRTGVLHPLRDVIPAKTPFWDRVNIAGRDDCWAWQGGLSGGYGCMRIPGVTSNKAHRHAWEFTNGPIPDGLLVLHRCDNPPCCNPAHLFLGTDRDNMRDKYAKGRQGHPRGQDHASAKLTEDDVRDIRRRCGRGEKHTAIAAEFGVTAGAIDSAVARRTWRHVT